ncbi:MAG: tetratricopeptide repeat protein [Patescibacteria group bacterium]|jgi:tetratricopeptide (TPR) repeat protein|nr:tetratricopeptide repeat protein [Patescibacteria group bacterium]|tara:strand:+ start:1218 stop:3215 length:1998 start_codon:yes stop_codon:yes gene_type:complete
MLDAILKQGKQTNIDWIHVQRLFNNWLTRFLRVWIPILVVIAPFLIISYGYSSDTIRMLVLAFMVSLAWIVWLVRGIIARDQLHWRNSFTSWLVIVLGAVVLLPALINGISILYLFHPTGLLAWLGLIGFMLILLQEPGIIKHLSRKLIYALIALYMVAALYPTVVSMALNQSFGFSSGNIPASTAWTRYIEHGISHFGFFGAGFGKASQSFWELAELVELGQLAFAPILPNIYMNVLWEAGFLMLIVFLGFVFSIFARAYMQSSRALKRLSLHSQERVSYKFIQILGLMLLAWIIILWFIPSSFMGILVIGLLIVLIAFARDLVNQHQDERLIRKWHINNRGALIIMRILVLASIMGFSIGTVYIARAISSQAIFASAFSVNTSSRNQKRIDFSLLNKAIEQTLEINSYRIVRVSIIKDALVDSGYELLGSDALVSELITTLMKDAQWLDSRITKLSGVQAWQLSQSYASITTLSQDSRPWQERTRIMFKHAISSLPRNAVLLTEAARFYRSQGDRIQDNTEFSQDKFEWYLEARKLVERALEIDETYAFAILEQAALLVREQKPQQALELIIPYVGQNSDIAYQAAKLSLDANQFQQAVEFYKSAIEQNQLHLQARFELVQAYIALSRTQDAKTQLNELEQYIAEDDIVSQEVISELRSLVDN